MCWTTKSRKYSVQPFWLKRGRSPTEDTLLDDVLWSRSWATHVGDALFFSLQSNLEYVARGRRLLAKEVNFVTKETARALGLPPDNFSSTSHRKGGISSLFGSGASEREILKVSTHASFTTVRHHYLFPCTKVVKSQPVTTSLLGITSDHGFATRDLLDLVMIMFETKNMKR
jgi:hypothetical protein